MLFARTKQRTNENKRNNDQYDLLHIASPFLFSSLLYHIFFILSIAIAAAHVKMHTLLWERHSKLCKMLLKFHIKYDIIYNIFIFTKASCECRHILHGEQHDFRLRYFSYLCSCDGGRSTLHKKQVGFCKRLSARRQEGTQRMDDRLRIRNHVFFRSYLYRLCRTVRTLVRSRLCLDRCRERSDRHSLCLACPCKAYKKYDEKTQRKDDARVLRNALRR